jgi:hypothetical protein
VTSWIDADDLGIYLQRDFTADPLADYACEAAADVVRTHANQNLDLEDAEDIKVDGTGTDALLLPEHPVLAVGAITDGTTVLVENTDWVLNPRTGIVYRLNDLVWTRGRQNISVTYTHGYSIDDVPEAVRLVTLQVAGRIYAAGGSTGPDTSEIGHLLPIERSVLDKQWTLKGARR